LFSGRSLFFAIGKIFTIGSVLTQLIALSLTGVFGFSCPIVAAEGAFDVESVRVIPQFKVKVG
jgi:hypothetical protein